MSNNRHQIGRTLQIIALVYSAAGCSTTLPPVRGGQAIVPECPATHSLQPGTVGSSKSSDEWLRREYEQLFDRIDAMPFWCGATEPEAYRLVAVASDASAIVVTLLNTPTGWRLTSNEFDKESDHPSWSAATFRLRRQSDRAVDRVAVESVLQALERSGLWTKTLLYSAEGTDGTALMIEGRRSGRYGIISQTQGRDDAFSTAAVGFLKLSDSEWKLN